MQLSTIPFVVAMVALVNAAAVPVLSDLENACIKEATDYLKKTSAPSLNSNSVQKKCSDCVDDAIKGCEIVNKNLDEDEKTCYDSSMAICAASNGIGQTIELPPGIFPG